MSDKAIITGESSIDYRTGRRALIIRDDRLCYCKCHQPIPEWRGCEYAGCGGGCEEGKRPATAYEYELSNGVETAAPQWYLDSVYRVIGYPSGWTPKEG